MASSSISTLGLSTSSNNKAWSMSLELDFSSRYFFIAPLHSNATYSVVRDSGLLNHINLAFIFIGVPLMYFPSLAFLLVLTISLLS